MCNTALCGYVDCNSWESTVCGDIITYKISYEGTIYDGAGGSGQGVAGDGKVLYYDTIDVSFNPNTTLQQYDLSINISNVSKGKVALDTIHFEALGIPILNCVSNSNSYATMTSINITGSLRMKIEKFKCGNDTYIDGDGKDWELINTVSDCQTYYPLKIENCPTGFCQYPCNQNCSPPSPPVWRCVESNTFVDCDPTTCSSSDCRYLDVAVTINSVTLNNLYVEVFDCNSWPPGTGWLCNWLNGLVSGFVDDTLQNSLKGVLQNTLDDLLRDAAGLPLDMSADILKDPFNFAKGCVNPGVYPTNCPNPLEVGANVSEIPLSCALKLQEEGVPQDPECSKYVGLPPDYYYGKKQDFPSWCDVDYTLSPPYSLPSGTDVTWPTTVNSQDYHFGLGFNQDAITEILNTLYKTGLLCIEATQEQSESDFVLPLGEFLKVETLSTLIPGLLNNAVPGTYAKIRFVPKGSPVAYNNWCVKFTGSLANKNCESGQGHLYDIFFRFPSIRIDFLAKTSLTGPYVKLFDIMWRWNGGIDIQPQYGCHVLDQACNSLPALAQMYLQAYFDLDFGINSINFTANVPPAQRTDYISDLLYSLLNATFSSTFKTAFRIEGLNYRLLHMGLFNPANASLYDGSDADCLYDANNDVCLSGARTWTDYFALYMKFIGNIDFEKLFGATGRLSRPYPEVAPDTFVQLNGTKQSMIEALSPVDARAMGIYGKGSVVRVSGYDPSGGSLRFSYRLDDGFWTVPGETDKVILPPLPDGIHTLEVMAINDSNIVDITPAKVVFTVDNNPPHLWIGGPYRIKNENKIALVGKAVDAVDYEEDVRVRYSLDGGSWKEMKGGTFTIDVEGLSEGSHKVILIAEDSSGNRTERSFKFAIQERIEEIENVPEEKGFGCSYAVNGSSSHTMTFLFFILYVFSGRFFLRGKKENKIPPGINYSGFLRS